jgi:MFS family permease
VHHRQTNFLFLNIGHFLDHLFILVFATVAALRLTSEWGVSYAGLIPYATPGFVAFGLFAIPAGWLADKWSREGMMAVFFIGIGLSSILTGLATSPLHIAISLTMVGIFAAIYHPVGLAMVVEGRTKTGMALAINGVFGNMGVASAALLTGFLIDTAGWRSAYFVPGALSVLIGCGYILFLRSGQGPVQRTQSKNSANPQKASLDLPKSTLLRVFGIILFTTAIGGLVFQSTTFSLPKIFDERLTDIGGTATLVGAYAFLAFSIAALAQLVVGYLIDRHSVRVVFAFVALLQAVFFYMMIHLSGALSLLVATAFMLAVFGQIPINDVLVGRIARSEWRSRAFALRYIVTFSVSASAVPLIAWIHGTRGFSALFELLAVAALLILLAVFALPKLEKA